MYSEYRNSKVPQQKKDAFNGQKITLHYFAAKARGEFIRILLTAGDVTWTRRDITQPEWPEIKMKDFEGGSLPVLDVDNERFYQSNAIARYIAMQTGQAGKDFLEMAQVDMMADTVQDIYDGAFKCFGKPEQLKEYVEGDFKKTADILDKSIKKNPGKKCLVSNKLTWADFKLYNIVDFMRKQLGDEDIVQAWEGICAVCDNVTSDPKVAEYIKNRPDYQF